MDFKDYHVPAENQALRVKTLVFIENYVKENQDRFTNPYGETLHDLIANSFIYKLLPIFGEIADNDEDTIIETHNIDLIALINYYYGAFDHTQSLLNNPQMLVGILKRRPGLIDEVNRLYNLIE